MLSVIYSQEGLSMDFIFRQNFSGEKGTLKIFILLGLSAKFDFPYFFGRFEQLKIFVSKKFPLRKFESLPEVHIYAIDVTG
jgi:hypothetical protein